MSPSRPTTWMFSTVLILGASFAAFALSDSNFTFLEDETAIVNAARKPAIETLRLFWSGVGEHEHPPLSDILLHFWLPVAGRSRWLLRMPSVLFFLGGLLIFAAASVRISGRGAYLPVIAIGVLSPFFFHFARLAGWYAFSFFLVAALTLAWLRFVERPAVLRLSCVAALSVLLVYTNYYGWLLVACLVVLDALFVIPGKALLASTTTLGAMVVCYVPLWRSFLHEALRGPRSGAIYSKVALAAYNLYVLFVSESVAPWFWYISLPAVIAIAASLVLLFRSVGPHPRLFLLYFAVAFCGLAALGKLDTKRLLFISGWLIMAFGAALANAPQANSRRWLMPTLLFTAAIGWIGIVNRHWYAAPHFLEPWRALAEQGAQNVQEGSLIVTNSPALQFYLNYALAEKGLLTRPFRPGWVDDPRVFSVQRWLAAAPAGRHTVLVVAGVNQRLNRQTGELERSLQSTCSMTESSHLLPDSGSALKEALFPQFREPAFRISLEKFTCPRLAEAAQNPGPALLLPRHRI